MTVRSKVFVPLVVLALLLFPTLNVSAQTSVTEVFTSPDPPEAGIPAAEAAQRLAQPAKQKPDAFGGYYQWTIIHASRFLTYMGTDLPEYVTGTGYMTPTYSATNYPAYWAQIELPNGAQITSLYARLYDNSTNAWWRMTVTVYEADSDPGFSQLSDTEWTSSYTPGYFMLNASFATYPLIRSWADLDGDGYAGDLAYVVHFLPQGTAAEFSNNLRFWGVAIDWARTISPSPASATFPDVPTGHWAFQYVEALAASGITQGYSDGTFRPTNPVTRAQMATFLARALGLHWSL